jgi:hypothetical protein
MALHFGIPGAPTQATVRNGEQAMNPDLKVLVEEFEKAINESVCESERIAAIVTDMKRAGYDITLVLEATIGVSARAGDETERARPRATSNGQLQLDEQDQQFLRALKIASDD